MCATSTPAFLALLPQMHIEKACQPRESQQVQWSMLLSIAIAYYLCSMLYCAVNFAMLVKDVYQCFSTLLWLRQHLHLKCNADLLAIVSNLSVLLQATKYDLQAVADLDNVEDLSESM